MKVRIVAPSGKLDMQKFDLGLSRLKSHGFDCVLGEYLFSGDDYFSAPDEQRLLDLQKALDGTEDLIWMARGGYGLGRIIDGLNWDGYSANPKLVVGFSDISLLLNELSSKGFKSIHGPMVQSVDQLDEKSLSLVKDILNGQYELSWEDPGSIGEGSMDGSVVGGNLSLIVNSIGTPSEPNWDNKIVFIEEVDEPFHKVDRMLNQLQRNGVFKRCSALIIGEFSGLKMVESRLGLLVREKVPSDLPVALNFPAGHGKTNLPVPFGTSLNFQWGKTCKLKGFL